MYARLVILTAREGPFGEGGAAIFRVTKLSWPETRHGFLAMLKEDRSSRYTLNWFAFFACAAEDRKTASVLFRKIGDDYVSEVWSNHANYEHYRAWAKMPSGG